MKASILSLLLIAAVGVVGCRNRGSAVRPGESWEQRFRRLLALYGHRNWIVVADSAYPAQSGQGIETVVSGADHLDVLREVLDGLAASKHVKPIIYTDQELQFVPEESAAGVSAYRQRLAKVLENRPVSVLPHMQIISKLDQVGQTFNVLIIKTDMAIPYTSVFLELDCAYWGADAEKKLRALMPSQPK
jgi:hypothetical protein